MASIWKERLDPTSHVDHFHAGGHRPRRPVPAGVEDWAYFVRVCGFTFEFASVAQLRACLDHYRLPHESSSRRPEFATTNLVHEKGHSESWSDRLPLKLRSDSKRSRVVRALERAIVRFDGTAAAGRA